MSDGLSIVTPPACEPIPLEEAKAHLRVDHAEDDALIESLISAARLQVETDTRRALVTQALKLTMDGFPDGVKPIMLPSPPLRSVSSITYIDPDGVERTLASSAYVVDAAGQPGRIGLASGESWPSVIDQIGAVEVAYSAGYGDAADVPAVFKAMIKLLLGTLYEHREATITGTIISEVPLAYKRLVNGANPGRYV